MARRTGTPEWLAQHVVLQVIIATLLSACGPMVSPTYIRETSVAMPRTGAGTRDVAAACMARAIEAEFQRYYALQVGVRPSQTGATELVGQLYEKTFFLVDVTQVEPGVTGTEYRISKYANRDSIELLMRRGIA